MNLCTAGFELGVNGSNILVADAGNATAWDALGGTVSATTKYDNTHALGTLAAKFAGDADGQAPTLQWTTALGPPLTDYYWRICQYATTWASTLRPLTMLQGGFNQYQVRITAGVIKVYNAADSVVATFATAAPTNTWFRLEGHAVHSTNSLEVKLFLSSSSSSPDETQSFSGGGIGTNVDQVLFGATGPSNTYWMDAIVMGATSYPGPVSGPDVNVAWLTA